MPRPCPPPTISTPKACLKLNYDTCGLCAVACQAGAIRFDQQEEVVDIPVGAVVLAPGFGRVSDEVMARYGLGQFTGCGHRL